MAAFRFPKPEVVLSQPYSYAPKPGGRGHVPPIMRLGGRSRECPLQFIWDMFKTTNDFTL